MLEMLIPSGGSLLSLTAIHGYLRENRKILKIEVWVKKVQNKIYDFLRMFLKKKLKINDAWKLQYLKFVLKDISIFVVENPNLIQNFQNKK